MRCHVRVTRAEREMRATPCGDTRGRGGEGGAEGGRLGCSADQRGGDSEWEGGRDRREIE